MDEQLLTAREVAEKFAISPHTVLNWVEDGTLPHYKLGRRAVRFRASELEKWLEEQRKAG